MTKSNNLPTYDQLPINPKYTSKVAWGVWGDDDSLGTLNNITEEITLSASKLVKKGKVFPLNWKLETPNPPMFQRPSVKHNIHAFPGGVGFDDSYDNFNPQSSSQWDGLGHICHIGCGGRFYNNVKHEDILEGKDEQLGIHHMARRGIATRAVLLDYARWAEKNKPDFDPFVRYEISINELNQVAKDQNVTFQKGDILLLRIGWMAKYESLGDKVSDVIVDLASPVNAGVKACPETYEWIWNNHFAAVGGDHPTFEAWPPSPFEDAIHCHVLAGFGCPIGEMFFLDALAEDCAKDGVYEFYFTSAPLNKFKGVASPPNALVLK